MNDVEDVVVASTNASLFAYVADGRNGHEGAPADLPGRASPISTASRRGPMPELIAWARTPSPALARRQGPRPRPRASTRPAARSPSSAASARARSPGPRWSACSSTAAACPTGSATPARCRTGWDARWRRRSPQRTDRHSSESWSQFFGGDQGSRDPAFAGLTRRGDMRRALSPPPAPSSACAAAPGAWG